MHSLSIIEDFDSFRFILGGLEKVSVYNLLFAFGLAKEPTIKNKTILTILVFIF